MPEAGQVGWNTPKGHSTKPSIKAIYLSLTVPAPGYRRHGRRNGDWKGKSKGN